MENIIIKVDNLSKSFHVGAGDVSILKNISLDISSGDFVIIFGPSGCGKSTLLHTILGLEPPNQGAILFLGNNLYERTSRTMITEPSTLRHFIKNTQVIDEDERSDIRKKHIGMVYQQANWIKAHRCRKHCHPCSFWAIRSRRRSPKPEMLEMGNDCLANYIPTELSSGQQQ
jgi:ABC-type lipoprotein export system ATPase subunit